MAYAELVSHCSTNADSSTVSLPCRLGTFVPPASTTGESPIEFEPLPHGSQIIGKLLQNQRLSGTSKDVIAKSWRPNTWKRYELVFAKWQKFCVPRDVDPFHPAVADVINYLSSLLDAGQGYSSICTAKSAISAILSLDSEQQLSSHPLVKRFIRGVFNTNPPVPRYTAIWDVGMVVTYLQNLGQPSVLDLKSLTYKLVALLTLLSASRVNYISTLSVDAMELKDCVCTFHPQRLLKHSRPGFMGAPLKFTHYPADTRLCVVSTLREYILRRKTLSLSHSQLLVSYRKPHKPVHKETVSRWLKDILLLSGIDTSVFTSHSFRAALTSKAKSADVPIDDILKQGQWSTQLTWMKFYNLQVQVVPQTSFADAVLDH